MRPYLVDEHKVWMVKLLGQPPHASSLKILIRFSLSMQLKQLAISFDEEQDIKRSKTAQLLQRYPLSAMI